jgi:hypothetical protein
MTVIRPQRPRRAVVVASSLAEARAWIEKHPQLVEAYVFTDATEHVDSWRVENVAVLWSVVGTDLERRALAALRPLVQTRLHEGTAAPGWSL